MNAAHVLPFRAADPQPTDSPTVAQVVELYFKHDTRLGPRARAERERKLSAFTIELGAQTVAECRPSDLESWLARMVERWPAAATRRAACSGVQRAFNWAVRDRRIVENPFRGVVVDEEDETGRAMTDGEYAALLRATSAVFRRVLVFLDLTGCRPGELCQLRWDQIDVDRGIAILRKHKTAKKTKRPRIIRLPPQAMALVAWILDKQEAVGLESEYVFLNSRGSAWTKESLSNRFQNLRERAGIPADCVLYGLRHRYATRAALRNVPVKMLAELLGHSSTATTEKYYLHLGVQHERMAEAARQAVGSLGK